MAVFRFLMLLLLVASAVSFILYAVTGQMRYRKIGLRVLTATVIAGLFFFAVLIVERVL